jgi:dihydroorotate dehydrogenase (fumarate)
MQIDSALKQSITHYQGGEDYLRYYEERNVVDNYLKLIRDAKAHLSIPVIASLNCATGGDWTKFAKEIEKAGADALEVNLFRLPFDLKDAHAVNEDNYSRVIRDIRANISIPIAVKIGKFFTNPAIFIQKLGFCGADGIVLFNRFYGVDIDLDNEKIVNGNHYSSANEFSDALRWTAILTDKLESDLCASTGIHTWEEGMKILLAGAKSFEIASTIYINGMEQINKILAGMIKWMEEHKYDNLQEIIGKLKHSGTEDSELYERVQFMMYQTKFE